MLQTTYRYSLKEPVSKWIDRRKQSFNFFNSVKDFYKESLTPFSCHDFPCYSINAEQSLC